MIEPRARGGIPRPFRVIACGTAAVVLGMTACEDPEAARAPAWTEAPSPLSTVPTGGEPEPTTVLGAYDLTTHVGAPLRQDSRGWEIEWQIPAFRDLATDGAIGQWYHNLEAGIYHTGDGWWIYYYGDDNGLGGNNPACNDMWGVGGACSGVFANLAPGRRVVFRYEYCDVKPRAQRQRRAPVRFGRPQGWGRHALSG